MKPRNRNILLIVLGLALAAAMCVFAASAGIIAYSFFGDTVTGLLEDPAAVFDSPPVAADPVVQPQTPIGADVDLASLFSPFWESRLIIHEDFYVQPVDDALLAQGALQGLTTTLEDFGIYLDEINLPTDAPTPKELAAEAETPTEISALFTDFWAAWERAEYADIQGQLTYEDLMHASLRGMVNALGDEHTQFLDPNQLRLSEISLQGEYEGIGAWVDTTTEYLTIIAPMDGSPAEAAGLQPGDRVLAIDGDDMTGIPGDAVINRILGPAGSILVMTIDRDSVAQPFDVEITRAAIFVSSVQGEILEGNIAYVQLFSFGATSDRELRTILEELLAQNPSGLILDLRNNGGGFLDTSIQVASEFIGDGVILFEQFGDGARQTYDALDDGLATQIEMVVLVNGGSASASEIVAGALQDHGRALLVGETTFGKGSVQVSPLLSDNQGSLRVTIAHWLTPDEREIHGTGLQPDVVVPFTEQDVADGNDPQLERAIQLLTQ